MQSETIQFKKLHEDAIIPTRGTAYAAGFDLYALQDTLIVAGMGNVIVPTGIAVQLPRSTYGRIAMRSGLAVKQHLSVSAGVIDIDYTGGIGVVTYCTKLFDSKNVFEYRATNEGSLSEGYYVSSLQVRPYNINYDVPNSTMVNDKGERVHPANDPHTYLIKKGERFAQLIPEFVYYAIGEEVTEFRRDYDVHAGFGSTGK